MGSLLLALPLGLAIGFVLGAVGGGAAVLALPVLIYVLGQDVHSATTASLVVVGGSALVGAVKLGRKGLVCWEVAGVYAAAAGVGTLIGTAANQAVEGRVLILLFVPVLLGAAYATWRKAGDAQESDRAAQNRGCPPVRPAWTGSLGFAVGLLIGFFGVGGGFVIVPTLAFVLHVAMRRAIATSLLVVFLVSMVALGGHLVGGNSPAWGLTLALTAAASVGALGGATAAERLPQEVLARGFAVLVTGVALYLLVDVLVLGGAATG